MPQVIVSHKDGREFEIASADFKRGKHVRNEKTGEMETFEDAGFKITSMADGSPYEAPEPRQPAQGEHAP